MKSSSQLNEDTVVIRFGKIVHQTSVCLLPQLHKRLTEDKSYKKELLQSLKKNGIFSTIEIFSDTELIQLSQLASFLLFLKVILHQHLLETGISKTSTSWEKLKTKKYPIEEIQKELKNIYPNEFDQLFPLEILANLEVNNKHQKLLHDNITSILELNIPSLPLDIIGSIYNTFIENTEQQIQGQHFTNVDEIDIINAFCITENANTVIDSGCGSGSFLIRSIYFLEKITNKRQSKLSPKIIGIEIDSFASFLCKYNLNLHLSAKNIAGKLVTNDFSELPIAKESGDSTTTNKDKNVILETEKIDACVGNPPYIRHELITNKSQWWKSTQLLFPGLKINQQSDLYVYYLIRTAALLNNGGRLGYVIASSWLDVSFGAGLQKFLLDHFKIIAIIDQQKINSFDTASVNTIIFFIERCESAEERMANNVHFIRLTKPYNNFLPSLTDKNRIEKANLFVGKLLTNSKNSQQTGVEKTSISQYKLEAASTENKIYQNGNWGARFLRSPKIYHRMMEQGAKLLMPLSTFVNVKYGIKTGANDFFYLQDNTKLALQLDEDVYLKTFGVAKIKHHITWKKYGWYFSSLSNQYYVIEKEFIQPVFKTSKEANKLDADIAKLKYVVLICSVEKTMLQEQQKKVLQYILDAEKKPYEIHKRPSVAGRKRWYDLSATAHKGEFIFPSKIGEKYRLVDNRNAQIFCDKVNYVIEIKPAFTKYADELFLLMNSISFRFLVDLFARQLTGSQTLSDVDVNVLANTSILHPSAIHKNKKLVAKILASFKNREQLTIHEEILQTDRMLLEEEIFKCIGLTIKEVKELHNAASLYIDERQLKTANSKRIDFKIAASKLNR